MRGKKTKGMVVIMVFFVPALTNAALIINDPGEDYVEFSLQPDSYTIPFIESEISCITGHYTSHLAHIAIEFHKPPVSFVGSQSPIDSIKPLPAVPETILMVSMGFLCVSLVKDRKFWLAALTGLIWAGKTGFTILPQLALQIAGKSQRIRYSVSFNRAHLCDSKHYRRLRSDIEGTFYIGLLRHLAGIPYRAVLFLFHIWIRNSNQLHFKKTGFSSCLNQAINCLVTRARLPFYCSIAFTIANLARGPPIHI